LRGDWRLGAWVLALAIMSFPARAATDIALCPSPANGGRAYLSADGSAVELLLGPAPAGCPALALPIAREDILWAGLMPVGIRPGAPIALTGSFPAGTASLSEIESVEDTAPRPSPPSEGTGSARLFGIEERARLLPGPVLECTAGTRPAGMVVTLPGKPERLRLSYRSTMPVTVGGGDDSPFTFTIPASEAQTATMVPWRGDSHLTVACNGAGRFQLLGLGPPVSGWAWRPEAWRDGGDALIARALDLGMDTLFVTVPVAEDGVEESAALAGFIARAQARAIRVWAVDGDPHAVLPSERDRFVRRAHAYAAYNRSAPPEARLAGLQLDIEPYVLPGYAQQPDAFDRAWALTVVELAEAAQMPTEAVVPFWFATGAHRQIALDAMAGKIAGIAVMAYRGDAAGVVEAATPALDWGAQARMPVRVAIENGPIPDEHRLTFRPTESGTLWQVDVNGRRVMILLARPLSNPLGPTLGLASRSEVPGRRISFLGDAEALIKAVDSLQLRLSSHPAFHGLAIHGILD
jgi:hypothetical protein